MPFEISEEFVHAMMKQNQKQSEQIFNLITQTSQLETACAS